MSGENVDSVARHCTTARDDMTPHGLPGPWYNPHMASTATLQLPPLTKQRMPELVAKAKRLGIEQALRQNADRGRPGFATRSRSLVIRRDHAAGPRSGRN